MKFLAILEDSFREATDTRVFPVMLGLSGLLLLFVGSISFTPEPSTDELRALLDRSLQQPAGRATSGTPAANLLLAVSGVETSDGSPPGPDRPFRVVVSARFFVAAEAERERRGGGGVAEVVRQRLGRLEECQVVRVTDCRLAAPGSRFLPSSPPRTLLFYEVTAQPTAATRCLWPYRSALFFGTVPLDAVWQLLFGQPRPPALGFQLWVIEDELLNGPGALVGVLLSVVVTAFFVPNMLQKGRLDLLLAKPIARWALLAYKYAGGLVFIFLNATVAVGGTWLVLGLRAGVWAPGILALILILTYFFAILYAVSVYVAVTSRSAVLAILLTCLVWFFLGGVGWAYTKLHDLRQSHPQTAGVLPADAATLEKWLAVIDVAHYVLPRTYDLNPLTSEWLAGSLMPHEARELRLSGGVVHWGESLTVSAVFILLVLGLACWRFSSKDY
jgi:ABC-type transport system involved in multi-copper enzyme maturation permease subunit